MREDFFEKSSMTNDCFLAMARKQMEILKEMIEGGNGNSKKT